MNFNKCSAVALNGQLQSRTVLGWRAFVTEQGGAVEFLDMDPTFLNGVEDVCVFKETTGGLVRVGEEAEPHAFQCLVNGTA